MTFEQVAYSDEQIFEVLNMDTLSQVEFLSDLSNGNVLDFLVDLNRMTERIKQHMEQEPWDAYVQLHDDVYIELLDRMRDYDPDR